ncbi:hypothetical protein, partial [Bacteroides uniformis]|uniref:hypothetical protein n=1 Tax=Bacteroides uniformis TaxID=820 RepID=UPI00195FED7F
KISSRRKRLPQNRRQKDKNPKIKLDGYHTKKEALGSPFFGVLGMSILYRVKVPKCRRWRQAHSQRQGLNREVPTEGSPRQTIDLTNRNGLRHMLSGKTARQVEAQRPHGDGSVKTEGT